LNIVADNTEAVLKELFEDSKKDRFKMIKALGKSILKPIGPEDFKDVYLSISKEQGVALRSLIKTRKLKNIVEFGTSFGISTLYMAQAILETGGQITTTELLESKAKKAQANFERAGVADLIELRVGDAMETLKEYSQPIDLLFLDGWKDLYHPLFRLLEPLFHEKTVIYVDNADMGDTRAFLQTIEQGGQYRIDYAFDEKVALVIPQ